MNALAYVPLPEQAYDQAMRLLPQEHLGNRGPGESGNDQRALKGRKRMNGAKR